MLDVIPDEPLQNKLVRNGFRLYFFQAIIAPAGYLIKMMISRELSVEDIGLFYSILGFISILSAYNDLWLTEALQYYLPHYFIDKEYSKAKTIIVFTWITQFLSWIIISWLLWFWSDRLAIHYFKSSDAPLLLKYFSLYFLILNLFQVIWSLFISIQNIKRQQSIEAVRMRSVVILTFISVYRWTLDSLTFVKRRLIWVCFALLLSRWWLKKNFQRLLRDYPLILDKTLIKQQRKYWLRILIWAWAWTIFWQINQQFALYFLWAEAAWYRTNYLSFYTIVGVITWPIISYLFPLLNELYKKWENKKIKLLYNYLFIWTLVFWTIWWILWYFFSWDISALLFGETFRKSWELFSHYAPFIITLPLIWIFFQDIASRWMVKQRVYGIVYALLINIVFSIILWNKFWIYGLVYSQLIANLFLMFYWWWRWRKI